MARQRTSPIEDTIILASKLPWYVNILLAIIAYGILHGMATAPIPTISSAGQMHKAVNGSLFKVFALFGQYVLPFVFGMAAVLSGIKEAKTKKAKQTIKESIQRQQNKIFTPPKPSTVSQRQEPSPIPQIYEQIITTEPQEIIKSIPEQLTAEVLREIEWKRFETLCSELLNTLGYVAIETDYGPDGGIDITVRRNGEYEPFGIVQCKAWSSNVKETEIRDLLGTMTKHQYNQGMLMTTSEFTSNAREFAKGTKVTLVTGDMIVSKVNRLPDEDRKKLLSKILDGDYKTPTCPKCGIKMNLKTATKGPQAGKNFWGCPNYPKCRNVLNPREAKTF